MQIKKYILGPVATNCYFLQMENEIVVIDPGYGSFAKMDSLDIDKVTVYLTHSHWDHIADLYQYKNRFSVTVWVHPLDVANLENPGVDGIPCPLDFPGVQADFLFQEEQMMATLGTKMQVIHTPGHSPGSVCFYFPEENILFSGDTLFKGAIGNVGFPTSNAQDMRNSLRRLAQLPKNVLVYPGHGATTILGEEAWIQKMESL